MMSELAVLVGLRGSQGLSRSSIKQSNATSSFGNTVIIQRALQAWGLDADELLREADIDPEIYQRTGKRVPFKSAEKLFSLVIERTGNPSIGIDLVEHMNPTVYQALGVALLCSSTLRNFCKRFERYFAVVSTLENAEFHETEDGGYIVESARVDYSELTRGVHADAFCAVVLKFMRIVFRPDYNLKRLELNWTPPEKYHDKYRKHFGCEVTFGAPLTVLYFDKDDLDIPLGGANASLAFQNDQSAKAILAELKKDNLQARVYARLIEYLPAGECSREKVAHSLYMSESAFQKKLKLEGTSYQALLDRTRSELSQHYLGKGGMSISEAAFLLGFTDSSNFSRAFKRWMGVSPSEYRHHEVDNAQEVSTH
jgi:AraC-like DNA-binding protein